MRTQFYNVPMQSPYLYQTKLQNNKRFGNNGPDNSDDPPTEADLANELAELDELTGLVSPEGNDGIQQAASELFVDPTRRTVVLNGVRASDGEVDNADWETTTVGEFLQRRLDERGEDPDA